MYKTLLLICSVLLVASCHSSTSQTTKEPPSTVYKFDIHLKGQLEPAGLESDFKAYGLIQEGRSSRSQNRWIFAYNADAIEAEALLAKLREHPDVIDIQMYPVGT
jgi:hypothetical protein